VDERIAKTMSEVGPSITLSAVAETVAFGLGAIVSMPAVNSFAAYSAVAILVDFLLQITCFVTLLGLDARRAEVRPVPSSSHTHTHTHTHMKASHFLRHPHAP
jgi:Niemann-Pick C1 protein